MVSSSAASWGQRPHNAVDHQYRQVGFVQRLELFFIRSAPNSPSSSIPGVSIITTGPRGSSSMDF